VKHNGRPLTYVYQVGCRLGLVKHNGLQSLFSVWRTGTSDVLLLVFVGF
jgi:hypothetical protein